ncbi:MAG TPA: TOMM precursor leader peptide-binding protein, partial [Reyranella sp.]|nr:TOMM precursor leader peptide-binding protein [Reyranella sp.]
MPALRLKPHFAAHVVSPEEVALLGEGGRYALRGKVYAAVVPLLDGTRSDDDIVARLRGRIAPELVYYALGELEAKGYAAPAAPTTADRAADAWWSGHAVAPPRSSVRLVDAGAYRPALAALRKALGAGGSTRSKSPDVVVIATSDYLDERLARQIRGALPRARHVLPARLAGSTIWIGPLLDTRTAGLFKVLLLRLRANRPADVAALARGAAFPLLPVQGMTLTFELAGAWIASAVSALCAGAPPPGLAQGVITLDPWTLEVARHAISIAAGAARRDPGAAVELAPAPKRFTADGGHRTCSPQETLARLERVVSPIAGIVPDIEKVATPADMHVYRCIQLFDDVRIDARANRVLGRPSGAAGKGASDLQARVSCLAEAVERYCCGLQGNEKRRRARIDEIDEPALDPRKLLLFSDAQYQDRDANNRVQGLGFNWVPARWDPARAIDWSPAWSLTQERRVWLPTAFCYFGYRTPRNHAFCHADSNGCAAGNTFEEAIQQGFHELVERDACALWWYNRVRRPGIDLASFDDPFFAAMAAVHAAADRDLVALDVTSDLGIPAVMAMSWRRSDGGRIHLGLGCHLEPRIAVSRALAELNQGLGQDVGKPGNEAEKAFDERHARWLAEATVENQPYLRPAESRQRVASDFVDRSTG